jgi:polyhydroxyalkanoate synthesis regulator phasin
MWELIGKGLLSGLGAVLLTREKIEEVVQRRVKEAKISKADAGRLASELVEAGERQWGEMNEVFTKALRKGLHKMDVGSRKDMEELKAGVDNLKKRLARLEQAGPGHTGPHG